MKGSVNMKNFLKLLLGTGLFILDHPDRAKKAVVKETGSRLNDLRVKAQDKCESMAGSMASALRRDEGSHLLRNAAGLLAGVGVGIGLGVLFAPARGQQTRSLLSEKAQELANELQKQWTSDRGSVVNTAD